MNEPGDARTPSIPCPRCGGAVLVAWRALLQDLCVRCHGCGLVLRVDPARSAGALSELHELRTGLDEAEQIRHGRDP
jgi:hypothetical protein